MNLIQINVIGSTTLTPLIELTISPTEISIETIFEKNGLIGRRNLDPSEHGTTYIFPICTHNLQVLASILKSEVFSEEIRPYLFSILALQVEHTSRIGEEIEALKIQINLIATLFKETFDRQNFPTSFTHLWSLEENSLLYSLEELEKLKELEKSSLLEVIIEETFAQDYAILKKTDSSSLDKFEAIFNISKMIFNLNLEKDQFKKFKNICEKFDNIISLQNHLDSKILSLINFNEFLDAAFMPQYPSLSSDLETSSIKKNLFDRSLMIFKITKGALFVGDNAFKLFDFFSQFAIPTTLFFINEAEQNFKNFLSAYKIEAVKTLEQKENEQLIKRNLQKLDEECMQSLYEQYREFQKLGFHAMIAVTCGDENFENNTKSTLFNNLHECYLGGCLNPVNQHAQEARSLLGSNSPPLLHISDLLGPMGSSSHHFKNWVNGLAEWKKLLEDGFEYISATKNTIVDDNTTKLVRTILDHYGKLQPKIGTDGKKHLNISTYDGLLVLPQKAYDLIYKAIQLEKGISINLEELTKFYYIMLDDIKKGCFISKNFLKIAAYLCDKNSITKEELSLLQAKYDGVQHDEICGLIETACFYLSKRYIAQELKPKDIVPGFFIISVDFSIPYFDSKTMTTKPLKTTKKEKLEILKAEDLSKYREIIKSILNETQNTETSISKICY